MDWAKAIEINQAALTRIVAALIAMVGLGGSAVAAGLPQPLYWAVARVLRPAESAVRRLIVLAARGLVVKPSSLRPMPKELAFSGQGGGHISFPLFDAPKRYDPTLWRNAATEVEPRIHVFGVSPLVPVFQPRPAESPALDPDRQVDALRLGRRLAALKMALDTLPRQARRMARWKARRDMMKRPGFKSPLRTGPPPGHRKKPGDEIDFVLKECHALARDALAADTS